MEAVNVTTRAPAAPQPAREAFVRDFEGVVGTLPGAVLRTQRQRAMAEFAALGLPTSKHEDWKYTSLAKVAATPWRLASGEARVVSQLGLSEPALVFMNGRLVTSSLPVGLRASSLAHAANETPGLVEALLGRYTEPSALVSLNTALWQDGLFLQLEPGASLAELHVVYLNDGEGTTAQLRNIIALGRGASARVIEHHVGAGGFVNAVTEVVLAEGASLGHTKIIEGTAHHVGAMFAYQERSSSLRSYVATLGGPLSRSEIRAALVAEGAEAQLDGLYLAGEGEHTDVFTVIEHRAPHCTSSEVYKGVMAGDGRGVWTGRVLVQSGAQKTSALQQNKNLLLSESAHADTRPQLEIYADDVKCAHGAAIGRLDKDALFYLRARGIDAASAERLLTYAFASEVVERLPEGMVRAALEKRLAQGFLEVP